MAGGADMCAFWFVVAVIGLLAWANTSIVLLFRARGAGWGWWVAALLLWSVGAAVGVWGGFFFEYQPSPRLRVFGAPVPAAFFHLEGLPGKEQWIDFITPAPILFAGSNIVVMAALLASPIGLVFWLWGKRSKL